MERDIVHRNPVHLGFSFGNPGENSQSPLFRPLTYPGTLNQSPDHLPGSMAVASVVVMLMMMFVIMGMVVFMVMLVTAHVRVVMFVAVFISIIIMSDMIGPAFQIDDSVNTAYAAAIFPDKSQLPALKAEFGQFRP
jgi:hypothetical protein